MRLNIIHFGLLVVLLGVSAASFTDTRSLDDAVEVNIPPRQPYAPVDPKKIQRKMLREYQNKIAEQETNFETYDLNLSESLNGLGIVQQQLGMHDEAIASFQRAMHIQRVNNGIYSLSQEPMLRGMIASYEASNDLASADTSFEQLYRLYARNHSVGSPELVALLKEKSDWHIKAYARNPERKGLHHLGSAYRLMVQALNVLSADTEAGQITLLPLWRNLAVANFLLADHGRRYPVGQKEGITFTASESMRADPLSQDEVLVVNSYRSGVVALEKIALYHFENPESDPGSKASALANLGDWHLMFGRYHSAATAYQEAWDIVAEDAAAREKLFGQPRLIPLPGRDAETEPSGDHPHVVADFSVTAQGNPRAIKILETFPENDEAVKRAGYRKLKSSWFRPQLMEGKMVASKAISYRLEVSP